ncbi:ferritin-like domain-containing protein [Chitinophaga nivalis]|uniref:Ferritin-like domain-containing protein n=1 Tax=Chitinophaga nivalis TaxID=2991709 RepID=A0ABT3IV02_9BACT|nr:ferritin-like domain-containing protein [Chitinophaga nivalis]MCW3462524.1 ferritin-like domain-containing protein [Chitinophaga nivalis]MCW3487785.1 ferritin-like domain-containing protein [Chitinophaga nivalis]
MDLFNIFQQIEKIDPEVYNKLDTRRHAMKQFTNISGKIALAAIPFALGSMFNKTYARQATGTSVKEVLSLALTLEYLEAAFYKKGLETTGLIPAEGIGAITTISNHETAHVKFLQNVLSGMGGFAASPTFDFTAGGTFATVFSNYDLFLALSQAFEDTGVRAYKGQAIYLAGSGDVLTAALNIHSVEARHAAHIRSMRRSRNKLGAETVDLRPWITLKQSGIATSAVDPVYAGEETTVQANVNISAINNMGDKNASESFDEPLTGAQAVAIASLFIKS